MIDNRAGAGGNVGMEFVTTAPADGYTLLMSYVGTQAINGALYKKLSFDPDKDFAPVATLATLPFVIVSKPDAGKINADVNTVLRSKEVIDSFNAQGAGPYITGPEEFAAILKIDIEKWAGVVKASGAQVDLVGQAY